MKIREFWEVILPKGFTLIAGEIGLDREITGIDTMENPDTNKWLKEGGFLITSGYLLKDSVKEQKKFIKELAEIKASGIGIKNNRYIQEISKEVIDIANEYKIPLILIPYEYTLSDVSNMFYKEVYSRQSYIIEKSLDIHEKLTNVVLNGGSIKEVTKEVVKLIGNPVIVFDEHRALLTFQDVDNNEKDLKENFGNTKRYKLFNTEFLRKIGQEIGQSNKSIKYVDNIDNKEIIFRIKPIIADKKLFGYIVVQEIMKKLESIDYRVIERASEVIVLEMIKYKAIESSKLLIRRDFFDDLLEDKIKSDKEIESLGNIHGLTTKSSYACMAIEIITEDVSLQGYYNEKSLMLNIKESINNLIKEVAIEEKINVVSILRGTYIICFIPINSFLDGKKSKTITLDFGKRLEEKVKQRHSSYSLVIGIGKSYPILSLSQSFKEAMEAMKIINQFKDTRKIVHFEDFIIYHLLNSVVDKNILKDFYENSVGKLENFDKKNNANLMQTLEIYFKCKGNISEAARMMYIHRNTFLYRVEKIKEILNTNLENSEELLELQIGIRIMNLLEVYKG